MGIESMTKKLLKIWNKLRSFYIESYSITNFFENEEQLYEFIKSQQYVIEDLQSKIKSANAGLEYAKIIFDNHPSISCIDRKPVDRAIEEVNQDV